MPLIRKEPSGPEGEPAPSDDLLTRGDAQQRWSAARAMPGDAAGVDALSAALLNETDARVREAILTRLAAADTPAAVDAVLPHLRSDDAGLRTGALDSLRLMRTAVAPRLRALLHDPDRDVRILACELLRQVAPAEASGLLAEVLMNEPDPNVCAAVVETMAEIGGPGDVAALTRCAERFPDEAFLGYAIQHTLERISAGASPPRG